METEELTSTLKTLDQTILNLGETIQALRNRSSQCYIQADSSENMANQMIAQASSEEDAERASHLYSQASAYMNKAEQQRALAEQLQSESRTKSSDLREYRAEYEYYKSEGQTNLAGLKLAADKLLSVSGNTYEGVKVSEALKMVKNKIIYNQNLVSGCQKRIDWIEQICGSDNGSSDVKVKRR